LNPNGGTSMRSSPIIAFWAVSLLLGLSVAAVAAPKKKLAPPPPIYNWTGFYIGGTAGGAWTTDNVNLTTAGGTLYVPSYYPGLDALGSPGLSGSSAMFGGKIGYNWQWNPLVLGIEGDISSFHFNKGSSSAGNPYLVPPSAGFTSGTAMFNTNESTTWLSTVRARVGYAVDRILFYGTGGAALTNLSFSNSYTSHSPLGGFPNDVEATSASQTRIGWAAGAGIDYNVQQLDCKHRIPLCSL